jgi:hypothetical protein
MKKSQKCQRLHFWVQILLETGLPTPFVVINYWHFTVKPLLRKRVCNGQEKVKFFWVATSLGEYIEGLLEVHCS